jgi:stage V sporulation protein SpoVS
MILGTTLSLMLFALALTGVVRANDPQIQQSCLNVAVCALAVRSGFLADRRSDLQIRHASLFASDQRSLRSDIVNPSLS